MGVGNLRFLIAFCLGMVFIYLIITPADNPDTEESPDEMAQSAKLKKHHYSINPKMLSNQKINDYNNDDGNMPEEQIVHSIEEPTTTTTTEPPFPRIIGFTETEIDQRTSAFFDAVRSWKACYLKKQEQLTAREYWDEYPTTVTDCVKSTDVINISPEAIQNSDESKYAIFGTSEEKKVVVTLGIGADVLVEQKLKMSLPVGSRFFGADPTFEPNAALYKPIGEYFPFAISGHSGVSTASIRQEDGSYRYETMHHIGMTTFMREMLNVTKIDFLLMDNEGAEYQTLPMWTTGGKLEDITVCQINVEFHIASNEETLQTFKDLTLKLASENKFMPIIAQRSGHYRVFMINMSSKYCVEEYLIQFF